MAGNPAASSRKHIGQGLNLRCDLTLTPHAAGAPERPKILLDGTLQLRTEQTAIGSYPRAIADALQAAGARVDLLLSGLARPLKDVPGIAMASQVFGRRPSRSPRVQALAMLWRTGFGYRRRLTAYPVPVEGMAVETLEPRLPPHDALFNASDVREHAHVVFTRRRVFTEVAIEHRVSAMHWAGPAPIVVRGVPNIYTLHDLVPLRFPHFDVETSGRAAQLHAMIARRADLVITTSERSREDLVSILGLPDERISVVYQHSVPPRSSCRMTRNGWSRTFMAPSRDTTCFSAAQWSRRKICID